MLCSVENLTVSNNLNMAPITLGCVSECRSKIQMSHRHLISILYWPVCLTIHESIYFDRKNDKEFFISISKFWVFTNLRTQNWAKMDFNITTAYSEYFSFRLEWNIWAFSSLCINLSHIVGLQKICLAIFGQIWWS